MSRHKRSWGEGIKQFYTEALARYKQYNYPDWYEYIARKMTDWYKVFPLAPAKAVVNVEDEAEFGDC